MSFDRKLERSLKKEFRKKGYTWQDIDEFNYWFIITIPKMLKEYRETTREIPMDLVIELIGEEQAEKNNDNENFKVWTDILDKMISLFIDANIETCSMKNKYEEETKQTIRNFYKEKWSNQDEPKETKEFIEEEYIHYGKLSFSDYDSFFQDDNNKKIYDLYHEEQEKIIEYTKKCQKEALEMFVKYFENCCYFGG